MNINKMRKKLYADSPFDLASKKDDAYRDGVDNTLDLVQVEYFKEMSALSINQAVV